MSFASLGLDPRLLDAVDSLGFEQPTPIQSRSIPPALAGRDLLACAATGSGKSAAFLLPILQHLVDRPKGPVKALILAPTRELAAQIDEHRRDLSRRTDLTSAAIFGGVNIKPQKRALERGVDILVATPGRLLDHLQHPYARLDEVEIVVLDEADRMLDMGFLPDVRRIFSHLPKKRQTLLFSATMPPEIAKLAREILHDPESIQIQRKAAPAEGITQAVWPVAQELKTSLLFELLQRGDLDHVLVFTRTKHRANRVAQWLTKRGVEAARIHGNRSQSQRTDALKGFKSGRYRVLVATDVAARGIDIEALSHVLNFDVPEEPESYIHRVGRTARAERIGDAWTFVSPQENSKLRAIERALGKPIPRRTLEDFDYSQRVNEKLEIPLGQRIAEIRARRSAERQRAAEKATAKAARMEAGGSERPSRGRGGAAKGETEAGSDSGPRRSRSRVRGRRGRGAAAAGGEPQQARARSLRGARAGDAGADEQRSPSRGPRRRPKPDSRRGSGGRSDHQGGSRGRSSASPREDRGESRAAAPDSRPRSADRRSESQGRPKKTGGRRGGHGGRDSSPSQGGGGKPVPWWNRFEK